MKRKSFFKLFLWGLGYAVMGNILAAVMTISLGAFALNKFIMAVAALFAAAVYLLLLAVPPYRDGVNEREMLKNKRVDAVPKFRWLSAGLILWGIMLIPSVLYLAGVLSAGVYRLADGAIYPLSLLLVQYDEEGAMTLLPFAPYVFMGFYALTAPCCQLGYWLGFNDKLNADKMMYD